MPPASPVTVVLNDAQFGMVLEKLVTMGLTIAERKPGAEECLVRWD